MQKYVHSQRCRLQCCMTDCCTRSCALCLQVQRSTGAASDLRGDLTDGGFGDEERRVACSSCFPDAFLAASDEMHDDLTTTSEDKDPSILWIQHGTAMMSRWTKILMSSGRWQDVPWSTAEVIQFYKSKLYSSGPQCLKDKFEHFRQEHIPLAYPTIKRKCFKGSVTFQAMQHGFCALGTTHTCTKPTHSCFRNIISFSSFPF